MNYPGNENLAEEIRERIINTFLQTLDLVDKGDMREAQLGCDFVLRLDPMFKPARTLDGRLRKAEGPVDVGDLRASVGGSPAADDAAPFGPVPTEQPSSEKASGALDDALDLSALDAALEKQPTAGPPSESAARPAATPPEPTGDSAGDTAAEAPPSDAAPAPASSSEPPPPTGEPVAELDGESEQRVQDLLDEGQAAFESTEYQSAIDAWSRIFLIDIDHPEANRRIDLARKLKAEVERKLEETFHDAVSKVEAGQLDEARAGFSAVLEMMPGHVAAQEYLARIDAPDFSVPEPPPAVPPPPPEAADELAEGFSDEAGELLDAEVFKPASPADPETSTRVGRVARASAPARASNQTFKVVGAAALVLLAVVGWLLYKNWDVFFPNTTNVPQTVQLDPITKAKRTYAEAGAAIAIAQLRRLSPGHPQYAEAQSLVAQWEANLDASNPDVNEPEPEVIAERDRWVDAAREAFAGRQFLLAKEHLERAASHSGLESDASEMLSQAEKELVPLRAEIAMFRDGDWEIALRSLWRIWEGGGNSPDVRRLMVDSYFNLGVRDLQRNDVETAVSNFQEAHELAGDDRELARLISFSEAYVGRPDDLLYRIFVKYLPFR